MSDQLPLLIFDVNETLLDIDALKPQFAVGGQPEFTGTDLGVVADQLLEKFTSHASFGGTPKTP